MTFKEPHQSLTESEFFSLVEKTFPSKWVSSILIEYDEPKDIKLRGSLKHTMPTMRLFTETNEYIFSIRGEDKLLTSDQSTYLGCIAVTRKQRAGETWRRGNDLADGPCTEATWDRIVKDILRYELVKIHYDKNSEVATANEIPDAPPTLAPNNPRENVLDGSDMTIKAKAAEELRLRKIKDKLKRALPDSCAGQTSKAEQEFELKQANEAGQKLYQHLGFTSGKITVGVMFRENQSPQLIVYIFTDNKYPIHLLEKPTKFYGYDVIYQETTTPKAGG